ncbi:MAG: beta-ketoacyl synthase chain length factor [Salinivirgaceae bacterium]|nr:beta-ketoacyl synthase chain length factor [Salinivirgaceae bacterium]
MITPVYIRSTASIHSDGQAQGNAKRAVEPDYKEVITDAGLRRRMSRAVKMGVYSALTCLADTSSDSVGGIITATGLGCLADTEKFMKSIVDNNEQLLTPTPFIQSTFNTIGGQVALLRKIHAYNVTYVHRALSVESALIDAVMHIAEGADNILLGAVDEITESSVDIQQRMGMLRNNAAGEGSQFFLLSRNSNGCVAQITDISTRRGAITQTDFATWVDSFLSNNNVDKTDLVVLNGSKQVLTNAIDFKNQCGEYFTAVAFALWQAVEQIKSGARNVLIANSFQNTNHSLILIKAL